MCYLKATKKCIHKNTDFTKPEHSLRARSRSAKLLEDKVESIHSEYHKINKTRRRLAPFAIYCPVQYLVSGTRHSPGSGAAQVGR